MHCRFDTITAGKDRGGLDGNPTGNTSAGPLLVYSSIVTGRSTADGSVVAGIGNVGANQDGNAYSGLSSQSGTYSGWSSDANALNIAYLQPPSPFSEPDSGVSLALTYAQEQNHLLPGGYTLQYDANWAPRPSTPQRGPYEFTYPRVPYIGGNGVIGMLESGELFVEIGRSVASNNFAFAW